MITRKQICDTSRTFLDTPFHHQGRLKNVGVDCAGLVVEVTKELEIFKEEYDYQGYSKIPDGLQLLAHLRKNCKEKNINEYKQGDILLFRFSQYPQHLGIMLEDGYFIHSFMRARKVVIQTLSQDWKDYLIGVFEFPDLID